ncbi:MMPL family transporter [Cellulomonas sp. RIT-PI-Y]|uniref:MMPL family transporter n=1 Tax=Cellulomonas sp. RIT-PI-Y TaxID=3035297 RepID=UPI0021D85CFA|nr:MMPL family transporter [Cellulomonas sp. RIT-PI-Y]
MAELLYRLGRFSARRAWVVIVGWVLALALAGGSYVMWGGTLSSTVDIPNTPTSEVTDRLQDDFASASGGTGTMVFSTEDGSAFTAEQQQQISDALTEMADIDGVSATVDPFATEAQRAEQADQLAQAQAKIDAGREQISQGQAQIDAGQAQITAGQEQLDQARAAAEAAGADAATLAQFDAQQAAIDAQQSELDTQQEALNASAAELDASAPQAEDGQTLLDLAAELRTVSEDGSAAVATVSFDKPLMEVTPETKEQVEDTASAAGVNGVAVDFSSDLAAGVPSIGGVAEIIGVAVAAIVLFIMLGTLIAAGLPLLTALIGVGVGAAGSLAFSGVVDMISVTPILGVMLGLAVGIDYSLFILNRHRRQLREGAEVHESIGLANGTSGNAVVFAGTTVLIALLALNVTGIPFLGMMGTVAAASVAIAVLVAITLTPALLGLAGKRVLRKKFRDAAPVPVTADLKPMSTRSAVLRVVAGVAALAIIALPALSMRLGLPDGSQEEPDTTQYRAYSITAEKFGAGVNGPLLVVADVEGGQDEAALTHLQATIGQQIMDQQDVVAVAPIGASESGTMIAFQVIPVDGGTSESTEDLVHTLRDLTPDGATDSLGVAGVASGSIDISEKLADVLPLYLAVVIGLSLIILILVFRSIIVPLIATLGFVLSVFAAFGGVTAIYQWGWLGSVFGVHEPGPVLSFLPTILIGVLFGLAMDYQLFLTSGMREAYAHGSSARLAVTEGVRAGRAVVTAAAIIMISVFGGFVFSHTAMIRPMGFGLAFGVLVDAFVIRMLVMPALMHLFGEKAWWLPKWLDRILPNVDVEGAKLERAHHAGPAAEPALSGAHAAADVPVDAPSPADHPGEGPSHRA